MKLISEILSQQMKNTLSSASKCRAPIHLKEKWSQIEEWKVV